MLKAFNHIISNRRIIHKIAVAGPVGAPARKYALELGTLLRVYYPNITINNMHIGVHWSHEMPNQYRTPIIRPPTTDCLIVDGIEGWHRKLHWIEDSDVKIFVDVPLDQLLDTFSADLDMERADAVSIYMRDIHPYMLANVMSNRATADIIVE